MKQLVFETSTNRAIIALLDGDKIVSLEKFFGGHGLSEQISPAVAALLDLHPFMPDRIVVGIGPGSFTGIRVGCSLALSLSFGWQIPLFTAPSLAAFLPRAEEPLAAIVDARSAGFYVQLSCANTPCLLSLEAVNDLLSTVRTFASPHPEKIQQRFSPDGATWVDLWPDPLLLTQKSSPHDPNTPLAPCYAPTKSLEWNLSSAIR